MRNSFTLEQEDAFELMQLVLDLHRYYESDLIKFWPNLGKGNYLTTTLLRLAKVIEERIHDPKPAVPDEAFFEVYRTCMYVVQYMWNHNDPCYTCGQIVGYARKYKRHFLYALHELATNLGEHDLAEIKLDRRTIFTDKGEALYYELVSALYSSPEVDEESPVIDYSHFYLRKSDHKRKFYAEIRYTLKCKGDIDFLEQSEEKSIEFDLFGRKLRIPREEFEKWTRPQYISFEVDYDTGHVTNIQRRLHKSDSRQGRIHGSPASLRFGEGKDLKDSPFNQDSLEPIMDLVGSLTFTPGIGGKTIIINDIAYHMGAKHPGARTGTLAVHSHISH